MLFQYAQGACFRAAHRSFFPRNPIIVTGEVEPAMYEVQRQLRAEFAPMFSGVGVGGVGGNTNLARRSEIRITLERDDVGGRGIVEEISVKPRELRVCEDDDGKLSGGHRRHRKSDRRDVCVEQFNHTRDGAAVDAQARMAVGDRNLAGVPDRWGERGDEGTSALRHALASAAGFSAGG